MNLDDFQILNLLESQGQQSIMYLCKYQDKEYILKKTANEQKLIYARNEIYFY